MTTYETEFQKKQMKLMNLVEQELKNKINNQEELKSEHERDLELGQKKLYHMALHETADTLISVIKLIEQIHGHKNE